MQAKYQYRRKMDGRGGNTHCCVTLVNVGLPEEEGDNKEHGNNQGREDIGGGPSLDRTRRNSEDKEDDCRCRDCGLVISFETMEAK